MEKTITHKKERILFTAIDVINEYGIQTISTKEIAKRLGISEGTVFNYFPRKSDLIRAVLEQFCIYDNDIFGTTRLKVMTPCESIVFYVDSYSIYYENYPAIISLFQAYDILINDTELGSIVKNIFNNRIEFIKRMIEEGQAVGEILADTDSGCLADIIIFAIKGICIKWRMEGYDFSLRERTLKTLNMLLGAFGTKK